MSRYSSIVSLSLIYALYGQVCGEPPSDKTTTISLDKVWAFYTPGTKDILELDQKHPPNGVRKPGDSRISRAANLLGIMPKGQMQAGGAIAVPGSDAVALDRATVILEKRNADTRKLPADEPLSVFFYSFSANRSAYVTKVELDRNERTVRVHFHFVEHVAPDLSPHFAIIPIGKWDAGVLRVKIEQVNDLPAFQIGRKYVCDSTTYVVTK